MCDIQSTCIQNVQPYINTFLESIFVAAVQGVLFQILLITVEIN